MTTSSLRRRFAVVTPKSPWPSILVGLAIITFMSPNPPVQGQGAGVGATQKQIEDRTREIQANSGGSPSGSSTGSPSGSPSGSSSPMGSSYENEMGYEEEMYDDGSGQGRSGRRGGPAISLPATMLQSWEQSFASIVGTVDTGPLIATPDQIPAVNVGPVLKGEAEIAYQSGNYPLALELYFGFLATEYEHARVDLQTAKFSKLLVRPLWQTRWGVSYTVRGEVDGIDAAPITQSAASRNRMAMSGPDGNQRGNQRGNPGMRGGPGGSPTGFDEDMSPEPMDMDEDMMGGSDPSAMRRRGPVSVMTQRVMLDVDAKAKLDKFLGLVAEITSEEFGKRYAQGDFGTALTGVMPIEPVDPKSNRGNINRGGKQAPVYALDSSESPIDNLLADSPEVPPLWIPGVMFYGEADSRDIVKIAALDNIDLVLHFDILLKQPRNGPVQNISRCRLLNVASGKSLGVSKGMDSYEVAQMVRANRGDEQSYVTEQLANLFGIIDREVKAIDMPPMSADAAKRRVGMLLSNPKGRTLRTLAEVRMYQALGLITPEDVESAFQIVAGDDGLTMLYGASEDKLQVTRKWAIRSMPQTK